jgi:protein involved in polysaccharide export with SLBB domain
LGACFLRLRAGTCARLIEPTVRIMANLLLRTLSLLVTTPLLAGWLYAQGAAPSSEQVTLAPGDSIRVVVWRKPEMSGDFIVGPDGTITHPLYQAVRVGGVPFATAQINLRNFLARFEQDPQFVAEPLVRVAISGEVGRPQIYALRPETSIAEAVAQAGGPKETGNSKNVRVLRKDSGGRQREFAVSLLDPEGATAASLRVHSGDQIIIDRKHSFFREVFLPGLSVIGSAASIYLVIDRANRNN